MAYSMDRTNPLRVTHVVLSLDCGGLERIVVALVREGLRLGQEVSVVCLERPGTLAADVEALNVPIVCLHKQPGLRPCILPSLARVFRNLRSDVAHTHQVGALFYAGPAARQADIPVLVHTEHGNHFQHRHTGILGGLRRTAPFWIAARYPARYFCVAKDIADELTSRHVVPRRKLEVIPNGIDTELFERTIGREETRRSLGIAPGDPVVGTIGRLTEVKRQDLLIRAFARVREQIPDAHLVLVGDGPMRDSLRLLAKELIPDGSVHFAGYQSQPERFLRTMDVFALTSRTEGMPLAILEAWASGLPVVTSAVGGMPALVQHGRNGFLFPSGDEEKLASLLCELIRDPKQAISLGTAGRQEVTTRYNLQRMAQDYQNHYLQLLERRR